MSAVGYMRIRAVKINYKKSLHYNYHRGILIESPLNGGEQMKETYE